MTEPAPTLNPDEIEFAKAFLGRRSDGEIAKMLKRAVGLVRDLRHGLGIAPKPSGRPVGLIPKDGKIILCHRCGVVKFFTRLRKDGEPAEALCRWCREEIEKAREEGRHRWSL